MGNITPWKFKGIGFDRTGTTRIGKFVINHSFLVPGAISVFTSCVVGSLLAQVLL